MNFSTQNITDHPQSTVAGAVVAGAQYVMVNGVDVPKNTGGWVSLVAGLLITVLSSLFSSQPPSR